MVMPKYEIILYWGPEDSVFIAEVPELPGCMAHGETEEKALRNVKQAIKLWIETAKEFGDPIPQPKERKLVYA
jgi:predicted RNase H-like HicB family nuclease